MKIIKYFIEFIFIIILLCIFKIIGLNLSRKISSKLFSTFGPKFRSKKIIEDNISLALQKTDQKHTNSIITKMWEYYGSILAEYIFIKDFRKNPSNYLTIDGQEILDNLKKNKEKVIFISGHFDNFELMAMHIEISGIDLAAIYRPLNNIFLNPIMEKIRKKYICRQQIKKGISGTKEILKCFKLGTSVAIMIDQRVSQGIKSPFFKKNALTTTIPAQFVKKFNCKIVPVYIERKDNQNFKLEIMKPITFDESQSLEKITFQLNLVLEKMIIKNPHQWIWTHDRWK
mgnify:CR=1 FL=1